jgi:hypothetical protein
LIELYVLQIKFGTVYSHNADAQSGAAATGVLFGTAIHVLVLTKWSTSLFQINLVLRRSIGVHNSPNASAVADPNVLFLLDGIKNHVPVSKVMEYAQCTSFALGTSSSTITPAPANASRSRETVFSRTTRDGTAISASLFAWPDSNAQVLLYGMRTTAFVIGCYVLQTLSAMVGKNWIIVHANVLMKGLLKGEFLPFSLRHQLFDVFIINLRFVNTISSKIISSVYWYSISGKEELE